MVYTLWKTNIAMDNHHFSWENSLSMAIFSSYVTNYQRAMENTKSPKNGSPKEWENAKSPLSIHYNVGKTIINHP